MRLNVAVCRRMSPLRTHVKQIAPSATSALAEIVLAETPPLKRIPIEALLGDHCHSEGDTTNDHGAMGVGVVTIAPVASPLEVFNRV